VVQDSTSIQNDRASSDYDVRHRLTISAFTNCNSREIGWFPGWQLGLIEQAQTGNPLNYVTANTAFTGNRTLRPNVAGPIKVIGDPTSGLTSALPIQLNDSQWNLWQPGRNTITGPSFVNTDFSVTKDTKITELFKLHSGRKCSTLQSSELRNPNLVLPASTTAFGNFNQIISTRFPTGDFGSARQVQFCFETDVLRKRSETALAKAGAVFLS